jgi:hypothetical protein
VSRLQALQIFTGQGDPIRAGMTTGELALAVPTLAQQFFSGNGEGHFYYAGSGAVGDARRQSLANQLARSGLK